MGEIQRGDMVVFWYPNDPSKSYIKRVIGLPGDTVEILNGEVRVNRRPLQEDYVPQAYRDAQSYEQKSSRRTNTSCSATIAVPPTTVATGVRCIAGIFTARRFSCTGHWTNSGSSGKTRHEA